MIGYLCKIATKHGCRVTSEVGGYPYNSWYKEKNPNALVYKCSTHGTWWV